MKNRNEENNVIETLSEFAKLLGKELDRYDLDGNLVNSVECTEDNLINLYNSQFADKTTYGAVYRYVVYNYLSLQNQKNYEQKKFRPYGTNQRNTL